MGRNSLSRQDNAIAVFLCERSWGRGDFFTLLIICSKNNILKGDLSALSSYIILRFIVILPPSRKEPKPVALIICILLSHSVSECSRERERLRLNMLAYD